MTEELKTIDTVDTSPFKKLVMTIGELPSSFVESMTYYELLAWLCNYLQGTVIPAVNNNGEAVTELQQLYVELKSYVDNYFDNLDVQEEINNKLDAMAEAGTLQEIISEYLNATAVWGFDTVADMKAATNLVNGSYARTLGFRNLNDGGGALYKITNTGTANEMDTIAVGSSLYAHLITGDTVNILQLGAKANDESFDNQPYLQRAFDLKKITIIGVNITDIFWVQSASRFYNDVVFNSWLKNSGSLGQEADRIIYIEKVWSDKTIKVINPLIDGNRDTTQSYNSQSSNEFGHGINIRSSQNIEITVGKIINCQGDGICVSTSNDSPTYHYSQNITIKDVYIDYPYRNGISIISCINAQIKDCTIYNRNGYRTILTEPNADNTLQNKNIHIDGGYYYGNSGAGVIEYCCNRNVENVSIKNCKIVNDTSSTCPIRVVTTSPYTLSNIVVDSVDIENHRTNAQLLIECEGNVVLNNINFSGNQSINPVQLKSNNGDIKVTNCYVYLIDNTTVKSIVFTLFAYNGDVFFNDNTIKSTNPSSSYSGQVVIREANIIYIKNNILFEAQNAFGVGTPSTSTTPSSTYSVKCIHMIDNYVKALDTYTSCRALMIYNSTDVDTLYVNYNFYQGIADNNRVRIWGQATHTYGDVFAA